MPADGEPDLPTSSTTRDRELHIEQHVMAASRATGGSAGDPRHRPVSLLLAAVAGTVGSLCVLLGSSQGASPFALKAAGAWYFGTGSPAPGSTTARFLGIMLVYAGMALMLGAWFEIVRTLRRRPGGGVLPVSAVLVSWAAPVLFAPPLFSRDIYAYVGQGALVDRGINPYAHGTAALGSDPLARLVDPLWQHATTPYGPAWLRLSGWVVHASGHDLLAAVVGFRLVAAVGVAVLAWGVAALARTIGRDPGTALAVAVLNPLVLLVLLGGAHNDALMLGLLVGACALARRHHYVAGLVLCSLAGQVKAPALIGAVFIGWWWAGDRAGTRRRLAGIAGATVLSWLLMAVIGAASSLGWGWIGSLVTGGTVVSWLDPATAVGLAIAHAASAAGLGGHQLGIVRAVRAVALGSAALVTLHLLFRNRRIGAVDALGWSLLAFVVLGPVIWPWYETWPLVVLGIVAEGRTLRLVLILSAVACFADVPHPGFLVAGDPVVVGVAWAAFAASVALFVATRVVPRRTRRARRAVPSG